MDKKYQVFISSTYKDMKDERQVAVEAILDAGHIPAGMELFAASDRSQMEVIRAWIDRSDIFMLILGGRYGSIDPESGKSYIQLEYEHAVATEKPFFALCLTDDAINNKVKALGTDAIERDDTKKLNDFRTVVKSKMCSEIRDARDIHRYVQKSIKDLASSRELEGWVRASRVQDAQSMTDRFQKLEMASAVLSDTNVRLRDELASALRRREELLVRVAAAEAEAAKSQFSLLPHFTGGFSESSLDAQFQLEFSVDMDIDHNYQTHRRTWNGTYRTMFSVIGASLLEEPDDRSVHAYIEKVLREQTNGSLSVSVSEISFQSMKMKFATLGVVELTKPDKAVCWSLTANGRTLLMKLHEGV
jgi:hypothetical protein